MLTNQGHLFSLESDVTFLNSAYMSPQLLTVEEAGLAAVRRKSRPYQISIDDFFGPVAKLKELYAQLIDAEDPGRIALIPSVSYGLANVARNAKLAAGDEVLVLEEQFPSNVYAWESVVKEADAKLVTVTPPVAREGRGQAWNEAVLAAINARTRVVALPCVHWADGTLFDLAAIRQRTREVGAWLVIDGTQSVGAFPFSVAEIQPDALVCGGYKWLMGPYSLGLAYYGPELDAGQPIENNWINRLGSEDFSNLVNYQPEYGPMATRYQVGELSNFILVPMLTKALEQLLAWGMENIQAYTGHIGREAIPALRSMGCFIEEEGYHANHLFGVHFPEGFPLDALKTKLTQERVHVGYRGRFMRVSPHVFNDEADFVRLVACFEAALA